jgi:hypothetical protein
MKVRVAVAGTIGKTIVIDTDAGATIGVNLKLPDGSVPTLEQLKAYLGISTSTGGVSTHALLKGLSADDHPQYLLRSILTTRGDILVEGASAATRLGLGTTGYWLTAGATDPAWTAPAALTKTDDTNVTLLLGGAASTALLNAASLTLGWAGTLGVARGGTNIASYTAGDLLYATGATVLSKLAAGTNTYVLTMVAGAPAWAAPTGGGGGYPPQLGFARM